MKEPCLSDTFYREKNCLFAKISLYLEHVYGCGMRQPSTMYYR